MLCFEKSRLLKVKDGRFFYSRSKSTKNVTFLRLRFFVVIYNRYYRAIRALKRAIMELPTCNRKKVIDI